MRQDLILGCQSPENRYLCRYIQNNGTALFEAETWNQVKILNCRATVKFLWN
jgi:hypothetical protein